MLKYICMNRLGYCCINLSINKNRRKKEFITINRGMTKKTFNKNGLLYVSELVIKNLNDLMIILKWNVKNNIYVYRMSSDMFPCIGFYELTNLPSFDIISKMLKELGDYIKSNNIRVSFHPSHFNVLASLNDSVVIKTIDELNKHSELMDLMGLDASHYYPINIHINTTQPTREEAANRFCINFDKLSDSTKRRLTLENDDGKNQYSVKMLYDLVHSRINIPIVFDQHHFNCGPQDQTMQEALELALSTWSVKPLTHMSSPKTIEDEKGRFTAHADFIYEAIETFGNDFDTEIEAKAKDLAVIRYINEFQS